MDDLCAAGIYSAEPGDLGVLLLIYIRSDDCRPDADSLDAFRCQGAQWVLFGERKRGVSRDEMADPAESSAGTNPQSRRDNQPENPAPDFTVVNLADAG